MVVMDKRLGEIMSIIRHRNKKHIEGNIYNYSSYEVIEIFEMYFEDELKKPISKRNKFNIMNWKLFSASLNYIVFLYMVIRLLFDTMESNYFYMVIDVVFGSANYYFYLLNKTTNKNRQVVCPKMYNKH